MKRITAIFTIVATTLLVPAAADAAKPETTESSVSNEFILSGFCGEGLDLTFKSDSTSRTTTFFAQDGTPKRTLTQFESEVSLIRVDTDEALTAKSRGSVMTDLATGESATNGIVLRGSFPAEAGPAFQIIGRSVRSGETFEQTFSAGLTEDTGLAQVACDSLY